ncbi:MAG: tRNA dihydrouridine(20/20a) synthase DusA [Gammaproteobacteria bacterium]|nr:tRNA dihydrouridine(20/20a) synthase DusA [Gammaproteobacteria bacterium]
MKFSNYRFSTAPMMEWTDRHWRMFARTLTRKALLYTEMVTAPALIHGNLERLTQHSKEEYPLALQVGGSDPDELYKATEYVKDLGFYEINLNLGCPSDRVRAGCFGAALMTNPNRVSECFAAMLNAAGSQGPLVTAKIRLGVNDQNTENTLPKFLEMLRRKNVRRVIIHARKAILGGLSPRDNRKIPPLNYDLVQKMKNQFTDMEIILNGGLETLDQCIKQLSVFDGVMVGRAAYQKPQILLGVDHHVFRSDPPHETAFEALMAYQPYVDSVLAQGFPLKHLTKHLVGLYHNVPGARAYRRILSERSHLPGANWKVVEDALAAIPNVETI